MTLTPNTIQLLKPYFEDSKYDADATRSLMPFAFGFIWSDERPNHAENVVDLASASLSRFMTALISFRASLVNESPHEPFRPFWNSFKECCPNWPGFRIERSDPSLASELAKEQDELFQGLEEYFDRCERARNIERRRKGRM